MTCDLGAVHETKALQSSIIWLWPRNSKNTAVKLLSITDFLSVNVFTTHCHLVSTQIICVPLCLSSFSQCIYICICINIYINTKKFWKSTDEQHCQTSGMVYLVHYFCSNLPFLATPTHSPFILPTASVSSLLSWIFSQICPCCVLMVCWHILAILFK